MLSPTIKGREIEHYSLLLDTTASSLESKKSPRDSSSRVSILDELYAFRANAPAAQIANLWRAELYDVLLPSHEYIRDAGRKRDDCEKRARND